MCEGNYIEEKTKNYFRLYENNSLKEKFIEKLEQLETQLENTLINIKKDFAKQQVNYQKKKIDLIEKQLIFMAKYNFEFKVKVIKTYLDMEVCLVSIAKQQ